MHACSPQQGCNKVTLCSVEYLWESFCKNVTSMVKGDKGYWENIRICTWKGQQTFTLYMKLNTLHSKTIIMDSTTIFYYAVLQCMRGLFRAILKVYLHIARQGRMHCIKCIVLNACIKSHVCIQAVAWYVTCKRSSMPLPFDIKIPMEPNWKIDRKFFLTLLWERNAKMWHTHIVLKKSTVRTPVSKGNQIHSSTLWTLRYPKMYMATLGYKGKVSLLKLWTALYLQCKKFPL